MNTKKLRTLQAMGLGPVWQQRGRAGAVATDAKSGVATVLATTGMAVQEAAADIASLSSSELDAAIRQCTRCRLCEGRTHAVPGKGNQQARWLFVGEGPGHTEDVQGEPFVGPAGKLLDNMIHAMQLQRDADTYITNIVKCHPVGADGRDRPPVTEEIAACIPYLQRQIALQKPAIIIALGKTAAVTLLGREESASLSALRGQPYQYAGVPVVVTYHPAYLLRKPVDKAKAWRDLCMARDIADGRA